ncbi:protein YLS3-like [Phalaenopsis equestris]|uniref:protein YLS3-like n=1 Tax=Phalaenopsis equestris TaxID=78828 RepID=UPI0009E1CB24|nr:protein YLS3-like [Phalaenopsis equestris]
MSPASFVAVALVLLAAARARCDFASDQTECTEQLTALLPCLAFVENEARFPTPDCCANAKTVVVKSFKCLCVLVKDRNEPGLGFKINVTRAVTMPGLCNVAANISECPKLLKLPPGSPAAQEFDQLEKQIDQSTKAKKNSSNNFDTTSNVTASSPSGNNKTERSFIGEIDMVLQLVFLSTVFIIWGN